MRVYPFVVLLVIISAGCIQLGGTGSGGVGLTLDSLAFSPSKINSNQLTKLTVTAENAGDYNIDNAYMYLFGIPIGANDWTIEDGNAEETFTLMAPQVRGGKDFPGEKKTFQWILRAPPSLPRDEAFTFTANTRACYSYKTIVTGKVEVISETEWMNAEPAQHQIETAQSRGPLKIDMISTQPLVVSKTNPESSTKLKIRINNVGDGAVTNNDCSTFGTATGGAGIETAILELNKVIIGTSDCTFSEDIYLQKGQSKEMLITCNVPDADAPRRTENFAIEMNYNYYIDKKATIAVMGTASDYTGGLALPTTGGGGAVAALPTKDLCSKSCAANGQKTPGICAATTSSPEVVKYPGTTVDVMVESLGGNAGSTIPGLGLPATATIKSLNLHDANAVNLGLDKMTLGALDNPALSAQYSKITTPKVGIVSGLCSTIATGMTMTLDGYAKDGSCETVIAGKALSNMMTVNGASGSDFKNNPVAGLTISSIDGRSISEITKGDFSSINVGDFKVSQMTGVFSSAPGNFLNRTKCDSSQPVSYGSATYCNCLYQLPAGYARFDAAADSTCNSDCIKERTAYTWIAGGACNTAAAYGETQCSGATTYTYRSRPASTACNERADGKTTCYCYDRVTLSATAAALLCK